MAKSRRVAAVTLDTALPLLSHQNAANNANMPLRQHWSDRPCSHFANCWWSARWRWPGCWAAVSITLAMAITAAVTMAAAIMEVRITGVAQSLPMATAGTAAGGTVTVIGIAERR